MRSAKIEPESCSHKSLIFAENDKQKVAEPARVNFSEKQLFRGQ